ncbi:MAG TPA: hypothetical protein VEV65_10055, partial [Kineosporiaceae bacterium]|nr:hypothetical protein [Kineosporiaceae bacterium]
MSPVPRSRRARALGGLLALVLGLAGCTSAFGGEDVGDPAPVTVSGTPPAGRSDPATSPALARFYRQTVSWSSCGQGFECAKVTAPIDWKRPATGTFQLAVARTKATGKRLGSLLINPGGPGVGGAGWVKQAAGTFPDALRSSYDLVGWDPRGTGNSSPVRCLSDRQLDEYYETDATPDDAPEVQALVREQRAFADACRQNTGAILRHLDTI